MKFVLAIDQGTTSTRCILFDRKGIVRLAQKEHEQIFPQPGWVEHDPQEIWLRTQQVVREATDGIDPKQIASIGITNQRETTLAWNRHTGEPYGNAIVWQDTRTKQICDELANHRGPGRESGDSRGDQPLSQYHRFALSDLFLRARSCDGFSITSASSRGRREGRCTLRHDRFLADLESHREDMSPMSPTPAERC